MDHKSQVTHILLHEYRPDGYSVYKQWQIYLQISSTTSVRLDMVPGYCTNDGHRGKVEITSASYRPTPADAALRFRVLKPTTLRAIAVLINKKKHSPYKLTDAWESERFWIYTILSDIESLGLIKRGSATEVDEEIQASKIVISSSRREWDCVLVMEGSNSKQHYRLGVHNSHLL